MRVGKSETDCQCGSANPGFLGAMAPCSPQVGVGSRANVRGCSSADSTSILLEWPLLELGKWRPQQSHWNHVIPDMSARAGRPDMERYTGTREQESQFWQRGAGPRVTEFQHGGLLQETGGGGDLRALADTLPLAPCKALLNSTRFLQG